MSGCLEGIRVLELGGKGPTPFAGMMLQTWGQRWLPAKDPRDEPRQKGIGVLAHGKSSIRLDLKSEPVRSALLGVMSSFDVVIEGFRPAVAEKLRLRPTDVHDAAEQVIYGRMSGYGQESSWSNVVGPDINFIAMSSALAHIGAGGSRAGHTLESRRRLRRRWDAPGRCVLGALVERARTGKGRVVDAAMTDGSALLMSSIFAMRAGGNWVSQREANLVDGGRPSITSMRPPTPRSSRSAHSSLRTGG